jgi:hypothetical protein
MCGYAYLAGKFPFPDILRLEQKVALCAASNASVATNFRLFTSGFHFQFFFSIQPNTIRLVYSCEPSRIISRL